MFAGLGDTQTTVQSQLKSLLSGVSKSDFNSILAKVQRDPTMANMTLADAQKLLSQMSNADVKAAFTTIKTGK